MQSTVRIGVTLHHAAAIHWNVSPLSLSSRFGIAWPTYIFGTVRVSLVHNHWIMVPHWLDRLRSVSGVRFAIPRLPERQIGRSLTVWNLIRDTRKLLCCRRLFPIRVIVSTKLIFDEWLPLWISSSSEKKSFLLRNLICFVEDRIKRSKLAESKCDARCTNFY